MRKMSALFVRLAAFCVDSYLLVKDESSTKLEKPNNSRRTGTKDSEIGREDDGHGRFLDIREIILSLFTKRANVKPISENETSIFGSGGHLRIFRGHNCHIEVETTECRFYRCI